MSGFSIDTDTAVNAAAYVIQRLGEVDFHKVFKVLYFAEQYHLKTYGMPLTGDAYQAMPYGPVPSFVYDVFRASEKGESPFQKAMFYADRFSVHRLGKKPIVAALVAADLDELSASHIEALNYSIEENRGLSFNDLVTKSHDAAWDKSEKNEDVEMSYLDIAEAAGSSADMMSFIAIKAEDARLKFV